MHTLLGHATVPTTAQNDRRGGRAKKNAPHCGGSGCGRTGRALMIRTQAQHAALHAVRQRQTTHACREQYVIRAGIEGTLSQDTRRCDLQRSRSIGLAKTRLQHLLIGAARNGIRVAAWLADVLHAQTHRSAFATLVGVPT